VAAKSMKPGITVVGVQTKRYPGAYAAFHGTQPGKVGGGTVAEGIAVKTPGALTMGLIRRYVDDVVLVDEGSVERAIFTLLEIEKTLAEGAGAAAFAALLRHPQRFAGCKLGIVISGGNIDMMILSSILKRGLVRSHRLVRLRVEVEDVPGSLGRLTQLLGELDSNIIDISQQRAFGGSSARTAVVELVLQMRGEEQADQVVDVLNERGFEARLEDDDSEATPP
jgi:threonine dehydratase